MAAYFAVSLVIGAALYWQAGEDFSAFFLGKRQMPWWLLGISMVATTFSTDPPNLVADHHGRWAGRVALSSPASGRALTSRWDSGGSGRGRVEIGRIFRRSRAHVLEAVPKSPTLNS